MLLGKMNKPFNFLKLDSRSETDIHLLIKMKENIFLFGMYRVTWQTVSILKLPDERSGTDSFPWYPFFVDSLDEWTNDFRVKSLILAQDER